MVKTTLKVSGVSCAMCEAHINDCIRREFNVKKAEASRKNGEVVIISEAALDADRLTKAISATGYEVGEISTEQYEKKGITLFKKRSKDNV